jgi:hypothetical protein
LFTENNNWPDAPLHLTRAALLVSHGSTLWQETSAGERDVRPEEKPT